MAHTVGTLGSLTLLEEYSKAAAINRNYFPYVNDYSQVPTHFIFHEACNIIFGVCTLYHAVKHRSAHIWWALFWFGFSFEVVGILVGSHVHPQFVFQVSYFCPLKEATWYAMTTWPSYYFASRLGLSVTAEAMMVGLLQQLVNVPYESLGQRPGILLLAYNPQFEMANVRNTFLMAPVINILANLILPTMAAVVIRICKTRNLSKLKTFVVVSMCAPLCGIGFAPMNVMKFIGCFHDFGLPSLNLKDVALEGQLLKENLFLPLFGWYTMCMRQSPVTENHIWALLLTVFSLVSINFFINTYNCMCTSLLHILQP
mmetsp:Transcript_167/g.273  ORF Transcript_167/g.273 Transcript_167/m.273 type:complete len:314 (-) Transcript_167:525-1466(-)